MGNSRKKRRKTSAGGAVGTVLVCVLAVVVVLGGAILLNRDIKADNSVTAVSGNAQNLPVENQTTGQEAQPTMAEATPEPTAEPTPDPEEAARQQQEEWNAAGQAILYKAKEECDVAVDLNPVDDAHPYLIAVNRAASTVTVYTVNEETGECTAPYMAMVCSGGSDTPTGFFHTPVDYDWRLLAGPCYGQYATRIWDSYLFHTVPYFTQHKDDLEYIEYNKLGTLASLGCIRLAVVDVKWIYDNCDLGTPVLIYDDEAVPGPMGKPEGLKIDPNDAEKRGWDPTDPDPANPWGTEYLAGTAIRSAAAQAEWDAAQADGRWNSSINPTNLQGYSHEPDYATRG